MYLRLRMGRQIGKTTPLPTTVMSYGKNKLRPEYWFSIPKNKWDDLIDPITTANFSLLVYLGSMSSTDSWTLGSLTSTATWTKKRLSYEASSWFNTIQSGPTIVPQARYARRKTYGKLVRCLKFQNAFSGWRWHRRWDWRIHEGVMGGKHDLLFATKRESFVFPNPMMMIKTCFENETLF